MVNEVSTASRIFPTEKEGSKLFSYLASIILNPSFDQFSILSRRTKTKTAAILPDGYPHDNNF